jgi:hypothetical protein
MWKRLVVMKSVVEAPTFCYRCDRRSCSASRHTRRSARRRCTRSCSATASPPTPSTSASPTRPCGVRKVRSALGMPTRVGSGRLTRRRARTEAQAPAEVRGLGHRQEAGRRTPDRVAGVQDVRRPPRRVVDVPVPDQGAPRGRRQVGRLRRPADALERVTRLRAGSRAARGTSGLRPARGRPAAVPPGRRGRA